MAPFHVVGTIDLFIKFANITAHIKAHIAKSLCTNIILGMDYINAFNLSINVKRQTISIEHQKRVLTMKIDSDDNLPRIPVTSVQPMTIPPYSTRFTRVSIPLLTVCSSLNPHRTLLQHKCISSTDTVLNFHNYCATESVENTRNPGEVAAISDSHTECRNDHSSPSFRLMSTPHNHSCNNIQRCDASTNNHLDTLVEPINELHHRNFNTTSHNIANTPVHRRRIDLIRNQIKTNRCITNAEISSSEPDLGVTFSLCSSSSSCQKER